MANIERRLSTLETKLHVNGNGHSPAPETDFTLEDLYSLLRDGDLRFTAPGVVAVGVSIGKSTDYYKYLSQLANYVNDWLANDTPGAVLAPINLAQVDAAIVALDNGDFRVMKSSDYGPAKAHYLGIGTKFGAAPATVALAHVCSAALRCFISQLPDGYNKADYESLEGLRTMLEWQRTADEE